MDWDGVIDGIQQIMIWLTLLLVAVSILALMLFDVLAGTGVMLFLTNENLLASIGISLATTGLLVSLMISAYSLQGKGWFLFVAAGLIFLLDVYFDSLTADYLRFGTYADISTLENPELHILYRLLIGGISTVGDAMAVAIIVGMPFLKEVLRNAVPQSHKPNKHYTAPKHNNDVHQQSQQFGSPSSTGFTAQRPSGGIKRPPTTF